MKVWTLSKRRKQSLKTVKKVFLQLLCVRSTPKLVKIHDSLPPGNPLKKFALNPSP